MPLYISIYIDTMNTTFLNRNLTSYPTLLHAKLKKVEEEYKKSGSPLLFHQYIVRSLFTDPSYGIGRPGQQRGMLLYHGTGTGKTIAAAGILLALIDLREPILLVKRSLQENFYKDIDKILKSEPETAKKVKNKIKFITADAYNSGMQMRTKTGTLNGKLLIVDEAHHFFKSIINSQTDDTNARIMYNMIMDAYDVYIVFLTGTPLDKDPFELVPAINMLTKQQTLPTSYEVFSRIYTSADGHLINKGKLQNRLFGLISHVSVEPKGTRAVTGTSLEFPTDLGIKLIPVQMSKHQYAQYTTTREVEESTKIAKAMRQGKSSGMKSAGPLSMSSDKSGSYYVASRQVSNFYAPLEFKDVPRMELDERYIKEENSPKIHQLVNNIKKGKHPALVYSEFVNAGLDVVIRFLQKQGYKEWTPSMANEIIKPGHRYALISGRVKPEDRKAIIEAFNMPDNKYGDIIEVILISETGAEGLDLKNLREVHILEPYWDWARIKQVKARGIRNRSHIDLPKEERNVKTFIYYSIPPQGVDHFRERYSIDEKLLRNAKAKDVLLKEFTDALEEVSIECMLLEYPNCRVCIPDNVKLFNPSDPTADISLADPCIALEEHEVKAQVVTYEGIKYHYVKDKTHPFGYVIYVYDKKLDGYNAMQANDPLYGKIIDTIKE